MAEEAELDGGDGITLDKLLLWAAMAVVVYVGAVGAGVLVARVIERALEALL